MGIAGKWANDGAKWPEGSWEVRAMLSEPSWSMRLVVNMYINGYSFRQSGQKLGISRQAAHCLFKRYFIVRQRRDSWYLWRLKAKERALLMVIDGLRRLIKLDEEAETTAQNRKGG